MDKKRRTQQLDKLKRLLKAVRAESGMKQEQLAEKLGETQNFISRLERGERRLDFLEMFQLCEVLDISPVEFVKRFVEMK